VIVGAGAAGLSATIAVNQAGAKALVVEKGANIGGSTMKAVGGYYIPNNHVMRSQGIADPKAHALHYLIRCAYPAQYRESQPRFGIGEPEYQLLEAFYDSAAGIIEALEHDGILSSALVELCDYQDHLPQNKVPRGRTLIRRMPDGSWGSGRDLVRALQGWIEAHRVPVLLETSASEILRNRLGEVIGIRAKCDARDIWIRARRAVIFCAGGYTHDAQMLRTFQPGPIFGGCAVPTNCGDFIRLGTEVGAKLGNMSNAWRAQYILEHMIEGNVPAEGVWQVPGDSMIIVNKYGRRVINEKRNYHERTRVHFDWDAVEGEYPNRVLFMVYDSRTADLYAGNYPLPDVHDRPNYLIEADTLFELGVAIQRRLDRIAEHIGRITLPAAFAATLGAQIDAWNKDALRGEDRQFQRGKYPYDREWSALMSRPRSDSKFPQNEGHNKTVHPFDPTGPYYALMLGAGVLDTNGGPVINAKAQILDVRDRPIPGLYGAGNCIASPAASAYWGGGTTIGLALTFGAIAGKSAATDPI
jgi:3-oxosteroid 1-dehydrogenase